MCFGGDTPVDNTMDLKYETNNSNRRHNQFYIHYKMLRVAQSV